jgi:HAD superfamily hydrolase (TIGR01509 family)
MVLFELIAFDLDGTLIELNIPFDEIRERLGIKKRFILEAIMEMEEESKKKALEVLKSYEKMSAEKAEPAYYAVELIRALDGNRVIKGVVTRNCRESVEIVARRFGLKFDFIFTRENARPKPSPDSVNKALEMFSVDPSRALVVGDFLFDLLAGKAAGTKTALIVTKKNREMIQSFLRYADYVFESLEDLGKFLRVV